MFVGLTGGIGSGKTTVAELFAELGARVVFADEISRHLLDVGQPGYEPVLAQFGPTIQLPDGHINRQALAQEVFNNPKALHILESIIHPLVAQEVAKIRATTAHDEIVIYESPLLIEKNIHLTCDAVIVVFANADVRLARLLERGMNGDEVQRRMATQLDDESRIAVADYVIDNSGSRDELTSRVAEVWADLQASRSAG